MKAKRDLRLTTNLIMLPFKWYTNGTVNLKIFEGNNIPDGFTPGFKFKEKTLSRKAREKSTKEFNKRQLKSIPLKERKPVYIPCAIFVTSWARNETIRMAQKIHETGKYILSFETHIYRGS